MVSQDEDFGGGDWVEPFLDPSPYGGKECWRSNYLGVVSFGFLIKKRGLGEMGNGRTLAQERRTKIRSRVSG